MPLTVLMPHNKSFLNPLQHSVLSWIANGCPPDVMEGFSHRITAKALEARGLVTIEGQRKTWQAKIMKAGQALLEKNIEPADDATVTATVFLQSVIDHGGLVSTEGRRDASSDGRLIEAALDAPNRPFGKKLTKQHVGGWSSHTTEWYFTSHFPDFVEHQPVNALTATRSHRPVVAAFRADRDAQRVSKDALQRAVLILQTIAVEIERRGYQVALPSAVQLRESRMRWNEVAGQMAVVMGENVFGIAISEIPGKGAVRLPNSVDRRLPAWQQARKYSFIPTGRLELVITNGAALGRSPVFRDTRTVPLETRLANFMFELEVRALEADWEHEEVARKAADKKARWLLAMTTAESSLHESRRVQVLRDQVARAHEAVEVRAFVAAARTAGQNGSESHFDLEWLSWSQRYADSIDPLLAPMPMPADRPFTSEDLKPFLGRWSPYGVDA